MIRSMDKNFVSKNLNWDAFEKTKKNLEKKIIIKKFEISF